MNAAFERLLDKAHDLARAEVGHGAAISIDPDPGSGVGFVARAWNAAGYVARTDEIGRPDKTAAVRALVRQLERG